MAPALLLPFILLTLWAAVKDVTSYTIPNWICLALAGAFLPVALVAGVSLAILGLNVGIGLAALLVGMGLFALRVLGGGDAKLLAAVMLWLGWPAGLQGIAAMALAGGGLAVLLIVLRAPHLRAHVLGGPGWVGRLAEPGQGVPYGVAICAGGLVALPKAAVTLAVLG